MIALSKLAKITEASLDRRLYRSSLDSLTHSLEILQDGRSSSRSSFDGLQFLEEEKLIDAMHRLERDTAYFFNMKYFEEIVLAGQWEEVEKYLTGFINVNDDNLSTETFFKIWKLKYIEALDRQNKTLALEILRKDLVAFSDREEYKSLTQMITLESIREHVEYCNYDCITFRKDTLAYVKTRIENNPLFQSKLVPPPLPPSTFCKMAQAAAAAAESAPWSLEDLPTKMVSSFCQSSATTMDFHHTENTLLLVGSAAGVVKLWDLSVQGELVSKLFTPWEVSKLSLNLQNLLAEETTTSVTRVLWSPDCNFIGAAFTNGIIHLYHYEAGNFLQHLELEAHVGAVNDIAFTTLPKKELGIVSCGNDKLIKVWDLQGWRHYTFNHGAPVYSICLQQRENDKFILSADKDGKIKAWNYNQKDALEDYNAPSGFCTRLLYSADGRKLFSCGTSQLGTSSLMEITEAKGTIKKVYNGLTTQLGGMVQFQSFKNHFLAAGEDGIIKFWHVDNANVLRTTDAEGGLEAFPCLCFDKEGNLLAVSTKEGFKILANPTGFKSLR